MATTKENTLPSTAYMIAQFYISTTNTTLEIESTAFASGGEGNLYRILAPKAYQNQLLKLYHEHKRNEKRERKLIYLSNNPPADLDKSSIAWPLHLVYNSQNHKFVGFTMPYLSGEKLEILTMTRIPKHMRQRWQRFDFSQKTALKLRLKLCFNLAAALHRIHDTQRYVMIDLKPDNILIRTDGTISMVDMDSIAVVDRGTTLFDAPVATPEYTPPETYRTAYKKEFSQQETWDRFSMAVIFYKLLFGVHPFAATCGVPLQNATSLDAKIKYGLFVHTRDPKKQRIFKVVPPPHKSFRRVPPSVQNLFWRCFDKGHLQAGERPSADEWCYTILTSQEVQQKYARPSELFELKIPRWDRKTLFAVQADLPVPILELPRVIAQNPKENEYIKFSPYAISVEIRFINVIIFVISVTMLSMNPFVFYSWNTLWILGLFFSLNDFYSYFFRSEYRQKQQVKRQLNRLRNSYLHHSYTLKPYFAKINQLWNKIEAFDQQIPKNQINAFLDHVERLRRDEEVFYSFLEKQDAEVQEIIRKEQQHSKVLRQKYDNKLKTNHKASKIDGETVSEKLKTLLYRENQEITLVEQGFLEQKERFEANSLKLNRMLALKTEEKSLVDKLFKIQDGTYDRLAREFTEKKAVALGAKKINQIKYRNEIATVVGDLFKEQEAGIDFAQRFLNEVLLHNQITKATDIQNIVTIPPPERYYWEDKVHHIFLIGRIIKISEKYDECYIQNALNYLLSVSQALSAEALNVVLSKQELSELDRNYREKIQRFERNVQEKTHQLENARAEITVLVKDLEGVDISSLDTLERKYKRDVLNIKNRYQRIKDFLKSMVKDFVEEKEELSKRIRQQYNQILEVCEEEKRHFQEKIRLSENFLSAENYKTIQNYLEQRPIYLDEKIKLERKYQKLFDRINQESVAYVRVHKQCESYRNITFRNHLRQLFGLSHK